MEIEVKPEKLFFSEGWIESYFRIPCSVDKNSLTSIGKLKAFIEPVGIKMQVIQEEDDDGVLQGYMRFSVDVRKYRRMTNRGAGRSCSRTMVKKYKRCKVSELKVKLQTMKKSEIIAELGCPKSTFYRILKNINLNSSQYDKRQIWDFTSANKVKKG